LILGRRSKGNDPEARRPAFNILFEHLSGQKGERGRCRHVFYPGRRPTLFFVFPFLVLSPVFADGESEESNSVDDNAGEDLVVEGTGHATPESGGVSASLTVIPMDARLSSSDDLASVLDGVPGAVVRRLGGLGDFSAVSIRGSGFRQVQVFLDGVPLNPDGAEAINLAELPLSLLDRVEVYRSNAPPEFGASPLGGVVNLVTRGQEKSHAASLALGQHGTGRAALSAHAQSTLGGLKTFTLMSAEAFKTEGGFDYFSDNGTIYNVEDDKRLTRVNNDKGQFNGLGRWQIEGDHFRWSVLDSVLIREEGVPGLGTHPAENTRLASRRNLASSELKWTGSDLHLLGRFWRHDSQEILDDRASETGVGQAWNKDSVAYTGGSFHGVWVASGWVAPSLTVVARREVFRREELFDLLLQDALGRDAQKVVAAANLWLFNDQLTLSPVVQWDRLDSRRIHDARQSQTGFAQDFEDVLSEINPRVGVLWTPPVAPGLAIKANVGSYLRPPSLMELFGNQGSIHGNTELVAEEGVQWDFGASYRHRLHQGSLQVDLSYFENQSDNKIVLIQNSQRTSVPLNFGRAQIRGVELGLSLQAFDLLESQSSVTWSQSENLTDRVDALGKQLPRVPVWDLVQNTALLLGDAVRIGHSYSFTAGNYWDVGNVFLAPPRALHGAFARLTRGAVSIEASVLNLGDHTEVLMDRNPFSEADDTLILQPVTDFTGYPLPGRTWLFSLKWRPKT
jgi:vitamin B12 transporter